MDGNFLDSRGPVEPQRAGNRWLWPAVLGLAALALVWFFMRRGEPEPRVAADSTAAMPAGAAVDTAAAGAAAAAGGAGSNLGAFVTRTLPGGVSLDVPERGVEARLLAFITDASRPVTDTLWFDFDRLLFETGSARLAASSQEQLGNVAAILEAYPDVDLKIGGYTDDVGDDAANMRLSQQRADTVRADLIGRRIAAGRLEAEGYGEQHPVADNSTEAGRAQNRRISMRVTKK
jgi:outer membrane protein OmpA-like peptidoglycan-associated protein